MKLRPLIVTFVILALLSGAVFWTNRSQSPASADPRVGVALGDPTAIEQAATVRLSDQGRTIVLNRTPDGSWIDSSYFDLPADFSKLTGLTGDLVTAKIQRLVTANPDLISRLGFTGAKVAFTDAAGRNLWSVDLGKAPDSGGRFVRFPGEDRAYLANLNTSLDMEPRDWADAQLLNLKPDDIAKVDVGFDPGGTVSVARKDKDSPWTAGSTAAGRTVNADTISSLIASLGTVRFSDSSDPADPAVGGAKAHLRTIRLTAFNGQSAVIAIGRKPEEKKPALPAGPVYIFITVSDSKAPINALMRKRAFQVDEYTYTSLPQTPADLFQAARASSP